MYSRLLIANRGEIACRIIMTARRLGITTIAVYSDADDAAKHVRLADIAVRIGGAKAADSYLNSQRLLEVAQSQYADALHPGYGFLSENAAFAEACEQAGVAFVGPPANAIRIMGSKREAKEQMARAGVPLVPGYHGDDQADARLAREAALVGYPVMLKASAGGGGKGLRIVTEPDLFTVALASARREARAAFGDDTMLLEKYLNAPRHVEVQVFADMHGNVVHMFERDCSVQRRHQKVLEEAPAPGLTDLVRGRMGKAAVEAARAIEYRGAGTVEFLLQDGEFYFMEMNTRLQVEHPVTEMITGLDLVEWQFIVAAGNLLPMTQAQISASGHALEARLYAEDPTREFMPSTGLLQRLRLPTGEGVRVDSGADKGDCISSYYDPMIAKIITHGTNRGEAIARMHTALLATEVLGVKTNLALLQQVVSSPAFATGDFTTGFLDAHPQYLLATTLPRQAVLLAALCFVAANSGRSLAQALLTEDPHSPWSCGDPWRLNGSNRTKLRLLADGQVHEVELVNADGDLALTYNGDRNLARMLEYVPDEVMTVVLDDVRLRVSCHSSLMETTVWWQGQPWTFEREVPLWEDREKAVVGSLVSPFPGLIIDVRVRTGDLVSEGQVLMVVEAMKMEYSIRAPAVGTVANLNFANGDRVDEGQVLLVMDTN